MKTALVIVTLLISGCGWFHRKSTPPDPSRLIVTGAPAGSVLYVDGAPAGREADADNRAQVLRVAPGAHRLEVKVGDSVTFREETYVAAGDERVITVLSGSTP